MEFMVKNSIGNLEKHFLDPQTGIAHKVDISLKNLLFILITVFSPTLQRATSETDTNNNYKNNNDNGNCDK